MSTWLGCTTSKHLLTEKPTEKRHRSSYGKNSDLKQQLTAYTPATIYRSPSPQQKDQVAIEIFASINSRVKERLKQANELERFTNHKKLPGRNVVLPRHAQQSFPKSPKSYDELEFNENSPY